MLLVAVVFHGATEVMQWLWPGRNFFRAYLDQAAVDAWTLLVSVAIAAYGAAYGALVGWTGRRGPAGPVDRDAGLHRLRMRWLLVLVVPLLAATWQGRGALQPLAPARVDEVIPEREGILVDLAGQFLVPLVALAGAVVVIRHGMRWLLPVLLVESLALVVAGTRAMIVFAGVLTVVGAAMHGVRPSRRQIAMIVVVMTAATALISSTRAVAVREVFHAGEGSGGRLTALVEGAGRMHTGEGREAILDDVVYRFDGNTFAAIVYQGLRGSGEPIGLATVGNNLTMLAPSLLVPDKVASRPPRVPQRGGLHRAGVRAVPARRLVAHHPRDGGRLLRRGRADRDRGAPRHGRGRGGGGAAAGCHHPAGGVRVRVGAVRPAVRVGPADRHRDPAGGRGPRRPDVGRGTVPAPTCAGARRVGRNPHPAWCRAPGPRPVTPAGVTPPGSAPSAGSRPTSTRDDS
ncbi:hypothetical protein E1091_02510 [Micromonospora fluostatini]|uniref:Uncharacterized protein n=1 Tax=Micromonospora fluostatini TaxID=1629071 RepID=A0ABY2DKX6_9ACTN|nr:hypothetical protein E1091_02510 [Micromonospora fluostatini]